RQRALRPRRRRAPRDPGSAGRGDGRVRPGSPAMTFFDETTPTLEAAHAARDAQDAAWHALDATVTPRQVVLMDDLLTPSSNATASAGGIWRGGWRICCPGSGRPSARSPEP